MSAQAVQPASIDPAYRGRTTASGPTLADLRAAFPGRDLRQVDSDQFRELVASHGGQGRLLTGPELRYALAPAAAAASPAPTASATHATPASVAPASVSRPAMPPACKTLPPAKRKRCRDSLTVAAVADSSPDSAAVAAAPALADTLEPRALREVQAKAAHRRDSLARDSLTRLGKRDGDAQRNAALLALPVDESDYDDDESEVQKARATGYAVNVIADVSQSGGGDWGGEDWAAVFFVVIGVVVVGAFVLYGFKTIYELATNQEDYPLFMEGGTRFSYSGKAWRDGVGPDLYRNAYLAGLRFAIGYQRPYMGIGLSMEGGYIDVSLKGADNPARSLDFHGGYLVAGPMLRFGRNDPMSFSLEFLNGTSNHSSIGLISKTRMTLAGKVGDHALIGAHLGAVFYELDFLDGLAWRSGAFNRDLSMVYGLDLGWEF